MQFQPHRNISFLGNSVQDRLHLQIRLSDLMLLG